MIPSRRQWFNSSWSPAKYQRFLAVLEERFGEPPPFRHSETPCFLPASLAEQAAIAGREIVAQLVGNQAYLEAARRTIPERYRVVKEADKPLFVQADFGLDSQRQLRLVEIQGFPSLYAYQVSLSEAYREAYSIPEELTGLPYGMEPAQYRNVLHRAIVGECDPENVVLLELDPWAQKTRADFRATRDMLGVAVVDARDVVQRGARLFYRDGGDEIPIQRIYNRVIADELERKGIALPFDLRSDLQVEWAGHPNWFFLLSKFSLPFVRHETVPRTVFLHEADWHALRLEDYVLKPLFSFAGLGVTVGPSREQIEAIAESERAQYVLQERIAFAPWIETPEGPTKLEIRVMYVWLDELLPVNLIIRMGRGAQMGVDFNKGLGWVGASAAFLEEESE